MRRVICNTCGTQAKLNTYNLAPDGWIAIARRGVYALPEPARSRFSDVEVCSVACGHAMLRELAQFDEPTVVSEELNLDAMDAMTPPSSPSLADA